MRICSNAAVPVHPQPVLATPGQRRRMLANRVARTSLVLLAATLLVPGVASAQTNGTYLIKSHSVVSPAAPTTTIEIWAEWEGAEHLFTFGDYDLTAGSGSFSNPVLKLGRTSQGYTAGVIAGNVVSGAITGQIHVPSLIIGNGDNPILLATYDWTTTDFTPRTVSLETSNTTTFNVVQYNTGGGLVNMVPHTFTPGSGVINVVPAPGVWMAIVIPLAGSARRMRRMELARNGSSTFLS